MDIGRLKISTIRRIVVLCAIFFLYLICYVNIRAAAATPLPTTNFDFWHTTISKRQSNNNRVVNTTAIQLCTFGDSDRFGLLNDFVRTNPGIPPEWLRFYSFGADGPKTKRAYWTSHHLDAEAIHDNCDAMVLFPDNPHDSPAVRYAKQFRRPLLGLLPTSSTNEEDKPIWKGHVTTSFSSVDEVIRYLDPNIFNRQKPCHVLIDNHLMDFHYFLLESFMALYPLPKLPTCNYDFLMFTFIINRSGHPFQRNRAESWMRYATTNMTRKYQSGRYVKSVSLGVFPNTRSNPFDYEIRASCYCEEKDIEWLKNSSTAFCVFHESCEEFATSEQAMWLSPHHDRFIMPTLLPEFDHPRPNSNNTDTVDFCVIGHPGRRNYNLVAEYLREAKPADGSLHIHNLGWGKFPEELEGLKRFYTRYDEPDFVLFEKMVYEICDCVLALLTKHSTPDYFGGAKRKRKQSGSMLQAIAYQKPMILHEELAEPYRKYLTIIETHDDADQESFQIAMNNMISKIKAQKRAAVLQSSA